MGLTNKTNSKLMMEISKSYSLRPSLKREERFCKEAQIMLDKLKTVRGKQARIKKALELFNFVNCHKLSIMSRYERFHVTICKKLVELIFDEKVPEFGKYLSAFTLGISEETEKNCVMCESPTKSVLPCGHHGHWECIVEKITTLPLRCVYCGAYFDEPFIRESFVKLKESSKLIHLE
jgi:hypothetical protein